MKKKRNKSCKQRSDKDNNHSANDNHKNETYEVGYGKPPKESQFKKGVSGNLKGRPSDKNVSPVIHSNEPFKDVFLNEAYRKVTVHEGGKARKIAMIEAAARSLFANAANGNLQAMKLAFHYLMGIEKQDRTKKEKTFQEALDYKERWSIRIEELKQAGEPVPSIIPHPDHIHFDHATSKVIVKGPITKEQKKIYDEMQARRSEAKATIAEARANLMKTKSQNKKAIYRDIINFEKEILAIINKYLGTED